MPLALPLMAGPGAISSTIVWGTRYHNWVHLIGFSVAIAILRFVVGAFSAWHLGWCVCLGRQASTSLPVLWGCY